MARADLTQGNINKTILRLTLPMIIGIFGMVAFNFADAAYVAQLGGTQLAALSFTFPVVMIIQSISQGLGMGAGSVISRVAKKKDGLKRLATDSLILGFLVVVIVVIAGLLSIGPLFYGLGATEAEMPFIRQYMTIWYLGVPLVVIPMVGNNIIRALGDTKIPGLVMLIAAGLNIVLDPLLIFGIGFFPEMGVSGAALATVISRMVTLCVSLYVLGIRERLICFADFSFAKMFSSFARVLHVGIPSALTRAIVPFGTYIITGLLAAYGSGVVAGYGAGVKTEFVMLTVVGALATVMISFTGQNFGVHNIERVRQGFKFAVKVNALYSVGAYAVLFFSAPFVAMLFSSEEIIMQTIVLYLRIAGSGFAFYGIIQIVTSSFNAVGKPIWATIISFVQMFGIYIPLSFAFVSFMGHAGIFAALVVSYILASVIGYTGFMRFLNKEDKKNEALANKQVNNS